MSGLPICQPSVNGGSTGSRDGSPSGAPAFTHFTIVWISPGVKLCSLRNVPSWRSACHGGITREATFSRIEPAQGRTSLNVMSDIGAGSPGRWHPTHLAYMMGATSELKVGAAAVEAVC